MRVLVLVSAMARTIEWTAVTDWSSLVVPAPPDLDPFDIGGVAEIKARHGLEEVVKLHWNENLFGPLPGVLDAVRAELENVWMYPEEAYEGFRDDVAAHLGTTRGRILPGHGTQALIGTLATTLLRQGDRVVVPELTYYLYGRACEARDATVHRVPMRELRTDLEGMADVARETRARIVWVCDPNNPTGDVLDAEEWSAFLESLPEDCVAVVDEAYVDYLQPESRVPRVPDVEAGRPVVILRSFSKFFGLAGLRLGCAVADETLVGYLALVEEPYNVNCAALAAGRACLRARRAADARRREVAEGRAVLVRGLRDAELAPLPSDVNFVLCRVDVDDAALAEGLAPHGILIRPGTDFGLPGYVRITVGPASLMERVVAELGEVCAALRS
jgi:histidinol-phosphate aminotransferase